MPRTKNNPECKFCKEKATHIVQFGKIDGWIEKEQTFDTASIKKEIYLCKNCWNHAKKEIIPNKK